MRDDPLTEDRARLRAIGERVMQIQFDAESLQGAERERAVIDAFRALETGGGS